MNKDELLEIQYKIFESSTSSIEEKYEALSEIRKIREQFKAGQMKLFNNDGEVQYV